MPGTRKPTRSRRKQQQTTPPPGPRRGETKVTYLSTHDKEEVINGSLNRAADHIRSGNTVEAIANLAYSVQVLLDVVKEHEDRIQILKGRANGTP